MKQRLGLAIVLFCLMPALFAQQKVKQNAREDNASFMFTESQLNEDDDAAQSTSALVTSNNDVYLSNVGYLFSPMRFRVRGYDSQYNDMYINGIQFNDVETGVSVSAILSCRPFFILIFLRCIKMKHYGFSRKSIWKNLETFP